MGDKPENGKPPESEIPGERLRRECADYRARRHSCPPVEGHCPRPRYQGKLAEADRAGSPAGAEVAVELHRLRDLHLGVEKSATVIRAADNRVVERYVAGRGKGGRLSTELLNGIDVADVPVKTCARGFAVALANQVTWTAREVQGQLGDGLERGHRKKTTGSARLEGCPATARQRDVEALRERGTWSISGTRACNADRRTSATTFRTWRSIVSGRS